MSQRSPETEKLLILSAHAYTSNTGGCTSKELRLLAGFRPDVERNVIVKSLLKSYPRAPELNVLYANNYKLVDEKVDISGEAMLKLFNSGLNGVEFWIHVNIIHSLLLNTTVDTIKLTQHFRKMNTTTRIRIREIMRGFYDDEGILFDNETVLEKVSQIYTLKPISIKQNKIEMKRVRLSKLTPEELQIRVDKKLQKQAKKLKNIEKHELMKKEHKLKKLLMYVLEPEPSPEELELIEADRQYRQDKHLELLKMHQESKQQKLVELAELRSNLKHLIPLELTPGELELIENYMQSRDLKHQEHMKMHQEIKQERKDRRLQFSKARKEMRLSKESTESL